MSRHRTTGSGHGRGTPARRVAGRRRGAGWLLVGTLLGAASGAVRADVALANRKVDIEYWGGMAVDSGAATLSRLTLAPSARLLLGERWRADLALRAEYADDDTGLGTLDTHSHAARPIVDGDHFRVEVDRATLTRRIGAGALIVGKQTVPWGVLDGVQITDRFDAVRRRDFVLTDVRPERLARWGVRWQGYLGGTNVDAAVLADPTVSQLAGLGDVFSPLAPRLRGGLPPDAPALPVVVADRDAYRGDATLGLRLKRRFGSVEASVLTLRGPDTDPALRLVGTGAGPAVLLDYPERHLLGTTLEGPLGQAIWRLEAAYVPDQRVNVYGAEPLTVVERRRWLVGGGLDVNAPGGWFVNAQLAVDQIERGRLDPTRPHRDVVGTLRLQRGFRQDTVQLRAELLGTLSDGDGVVRPVVEWRGHSHLRLELGGDLLFGERDELFGQYRDASRIWVRVRFSL